MENSKSKSKGSIIKKSAPDKEITYLQSREYDNFINTMVSVVEKYGAEILEEIEFAV